MELAKIHVSGVMASVIARKPIPAGIIGATISFEFDDSWEGLRRTVVVKGMQTRDILDVTDEITIPAETVAVTGTRLMIGVYGVSEDGARGIPTLWADLGVIQKAADPSGDTSTDPQLPIWADLLNRMEKLEGFAKDSQADLDQNDPNVGSYVKNRTHYTEVVTAEVLPETTLDFSTGNATLPHRIGLIAGEQYIVNWKGTEYICTAIEVEVEGIAAVAMGNLTWGTEEDTGEPFVIYDVPDVMLETVGFSAAIGCWETGYIPVSISGRGEIVHKLDNKYLDLAWLPAESRKVAIPMQTINASGRVGEVYVAMIDYINLYDGQKVTVEYDGAVYNCVVSAKGRSTLIGNMAVYPDGGLNTGEPFCALFIPADNADNAMGGIYCTTEGEHTLSIIVFEPNKLPSGFLPTATETNQGGVKAVPATSDMTQDVGITEDGKLVTRPGGGSSERYTLPVATAETLGGVKPVAKTEDMTQPVGVDENGGLFTVPGGSGEASGSSESAWGVVGDVTLEEDVSAINIPLTKPCKKVYIALTPHGSDANTVTSYAPYAAIVGEEGTSGGSIMMELYNPSGAGMKWSFMHVFSEILPGGIFHAYKLHGTSAPPTDGWKISSRWPASIKGELLDSTDSSEIFSVRLEMWGPVFGVGTRVVVIGA